MLTSKNLRVINPSIDIVSPLTSRGGYIMAMLDRRIQVIKSKIPPQRSVAKINRDVLQELLTFETLKANKEHRAVGIYIRHNGWARRGLRYYMGEFIVDVPDSFRSGVKQALKRYPKDYHEGRKPIVGYEEADGTVTTYLDYCRVREFNFKHIEVKTLPQAIYITSIFLGVTNTYSEKEFQKLSDNGQSSNVHSTQSKPSKQLLDKLRQAQGFVQYTNSTDNGQVSNVYSTQQTENGQVSNVRLTTQEELELLKYLPLIFNELVDLNKNLTAMQSRGNDLTLDTNRILNSMLETLTLKQQGIYDLPEQSNEDVDDIYFGGNQAINSALVIPNAEFIKHIFNRFDHYKSLNTSNAGAYRAISKELDLATDQTLIDMRNEYFKANPQVKNGFSERYLKNLITVQFKINEHGNVVRR